MAGGWYSTEREGVAMSDRQDKRGKTRREFLKGAAVAGGGLMAGVALPGAAVAATETESPEADSPQQGYRVTEHIASYYKTLES
jgi:hypothetical protein